MKTFLKIALVAVALLIQLTLLNFFTVLGLKPDLILIIIVVLALLKGEQEGSISGFLAGLSQDFFSSSLLGINALAKTSLGFICGVLKTRIFPEHIIYLVPLITFFASLLHSLMVFFIFRSFGMEYNFILNVKQIFLPEALFNSILSPFIFLIVNRILSKF